MTDAALTTHIWPDVFVTGKLVVPNTKEDKKKVVSLALTAWGNCCVAKPPEKFGEGMAAISNYLGITATPESLMALADKLLAEQ